MISFFSVFDIILSSFHWFSDIYMMNRSIQTGRDNQILRTASALVDISTQKQAQILARELVEWVKSNDTAVGLAAPQTGVNLRVIACALGTETPDGYEIRRVVGMINPCIVEASNEMCREEEACFSVPWEIGLVVRSTWIVLHYLDENFKSQKIKLAGFAARVVMHEIDHLDGVLFVDKLDESPQPIL
jgi:peptide deformylase